VFRSNPHARDVSRQVARLPLDYLVCRLADHWIVVGPTGLFVVGQVGDDPLGVAEATLSLAHRVRSRLSDVVPWVPFVDSLVVSEEPNMSLPCTVVDIATLEMALLSGPVSIDSSGTAQLREHLPRVLLQIEAAEEVAGAGRAGALPLDLG
jgi:hypothetical protein